ncbi:hypothetical protein [Mycolicibacterium rutilum]|uniref:hypothetical protein n=1 Tax=Mycolicibacterium rutilum TaxID=370526 RepID=UPI000B066928|nr:hypothetical protein [Mycolicibacterium rutilum]
MINAQFVRRSVSACAVAALSMTPFLVPGLDAGTTAVAGGSPGYVEPAPAPPPPPGAAPAAALPPPPPIGSGIRDPRCGTDLFTGTPLPC